MAYSRGLKNLARRAKDYFIDKTSRHIEINRANYGEDYAGKKPSDIGLPNMPMPKMMPKKK